jgi:hypothetical protein
MARRRGSQRDEQEPTRREEPAPAAPVAGSAASVLALQRTQGNASVARWLEGGAPGQKIARVTAELEDKVEDKDESARFEGDTRLDKIQAGKTALCAGMHGLQVTKLQQALVDAGYKLPKHGVDGKFGPETEAALKAFQGDAKVKPTGVLDKATLNALNTKYDTRQPYVDNATYDPWDPKTRTLSAEDKAGIQDAMVPKGAPGSSPTFKETVAGKKYGDRMRTQLDAVIKGLHKNLFADKQALRADPAKNFHKWSTLEGAAAASKKVTDAVYGSYATAPPMTQASGNFVDQWADEEARNAALDPTDKKAKARDKVIYLISANCADVNRLHSANPSGAKEAPILDPIIDSFVDTDAKVQILLETDIGWEGAQLDGTVYLQRFKQDTDEKNRAQLWEIFHTCIHEYLHTLAHPDYKAYAETQDKVRKHTLVEGFCDFFTLNVRKTVKVDTALRQQIEGPYYDAKAAVPVVHPGVYPSHAQAEQVVSIAGIRNAAAAYFRGEVDKLGGP